ncbi:MAG: histidine phosphatase family protein [Minisyncoccota bacterium]
MMTKIQNAATVYIVRHGETEMNAQGIVQGHVDSPLTETGVAQAHALGEQFKDISFDAVFSSDLVRAQRTAEIVTLEKKLVVNTTALLRERSYGTFDGKPAKEYREENKEVLEKIKILERYARRKFKIAPDVESDNEICARMLLFLREIGVTYAGKTVLVVTHGGIMRALLNHLGWSGENDLPGRAVKNTACIQLATDGVEFDVLSTTGVEREHTHG